MHPSRYKQVTDRNEQDRLIVEMGDFVAAMARWDVVFHLTWEKEMYLNAAQRQVERFFQYDCPKASYFYALEQNPERPGFHAHGLLVGLGETRRDYIWRKWFEANGRAEIVPLGMRRNPRWREPGALRWIERTDMGSHPDAASVAVTDYCAKYVCKEGAWWDFKLKGRYHPKSVALEGAALVLS